MFAAENALQEFQAFLSRRGLAVTTLGVAGGCAAMLDFYQDQRPAECAQTPDGDMLLFQWGTYDWGEGEHFQLDLTRQLILSDEAEDEDIWQLSLTFLFEPVDDLRAVGAGNEWCTTVQALPKFRTDVSRSAALAACSARPLVRATLRYDCAG
ncbi:MAG TPA: hypothetical protein VF051_13085 [Hyphomicrobiaceae bacterium]